MKSKVKNHFHTLGVINVTPNSFSDGGNDLIKENLLRHLNYLNEFKKVVVDVGFESTAPMNTPISLEAEKRRFDFFLHTVGDFSVLETISIDSYKVENYSYFYQKLKEKNKNIKIIFNDVGGILNSDLARKLSEMPEASYVFCVSRIHDRALVHQHMKNLKSEESSRSIVEEVRAQFLRAIEFFNHSKLKNELILDPGFGFSKTMDDNWTLIEHFNECLSGIAQPILIGLSKKSFIHKKIDSQHSKEDSEFVHYQLISDLLDKCPSHRLIFRVHDPEIVELAMKLKTS